MKRYKADKAQQLSRIRSVQEMLLNGNCAGDIIAYISNQWSITERQSQSYVKWAYDEFKAQTSATMEEQTSFHIQARMRLYKNNLNKDDKLALDVLKDIAKLKGMYVEKIDMTTKQEISIVKIVDIDGTEI